MKTLFFILVLLNSVFFLWEFSRSSPYQTGEESVGAVPYEAGVERIVLVSEQPPQAEQSAKGDPEFGGASSVPAAVLSVFPGQANLTGLADQVLRSAGDYLEQTLLSEAREELQVEVNRRFSLFAVDLPVVATGPLAEMRAEEPVYSLYRPRPDVITDARPNTCFILGPWFTRAEAYRASERLTESGFAPATVRKRADKETGYMVIYPSAASLQASRENLKFLKSKGIGDMWLISNGEMRGAISLGVFKRKASAATMADDLNSRGIAAEVRPRFSKKNAFFLVVKSDQRIDEIRLSLDGVDTGDEQLSKLDDCSQAAP